MPTPENGSGRATSRKAAVPSARETFFELIELDGDLTTAATATVRAYLRNRKVRKARTFAQVLQQEPGRIAEIGAIAMAMVAARSDLYRQSWQLFARAPLPEVLRGAAAEYFRVGFIIDPSAAGSTLDAVMRGEFAAHADPLGWLDVARTSLVAGSEAQSRFALERAEAGFADLPRPAAKAARRTAEQLATWYGRDAGISTSPAGGLSFGVLAFRQPDPDAMSPNLGNYLESLASLSHLTRRADLALTADADLLAVTDELRARLPDSDAAATPSATAQLTVVDRDASSWSTVADGTWLVYAGTLPRPVFGVRAEFPLDPRLRPIFVSVHIDSVDRLTPAALDYLRRYAPIGCRDWPSALLLLAAGVPAFFAGALSSTLDVTAPAAPADRSGAVYVDLDVDLIGEPDGTVGVRVSQDSAKVRKRSPAENLRVAIQRVDSYRLAGSVTSSRLQSYLVARAVGTESRLKPRNPSQRRFDGLDSLDDAAFAAMRQQLTDRVATVLDAVLTGQEEVEVYDLWRRLCAADVVEAEARRADVPPMPPSAFDIGAACATIRDNGVTVERREPAPPGDEINVEFSLDANYKHQLEVVLDSIEFHTSRPVRAFVLCREHGPEDHDRLAALFPTVSFEWLPTDAVDYGPISGLLGHTTIATMDRLLLPDLLPEISRIIHHDLDALCVADLAEFFDTDLAGTPVGGVGAPLPSLSSGFASFLRQSERFRDHPELGRELVRRTHGRHEFDFVVLNAGIMVLGLDRMRADDFGRNFVAYVERFGMNDQSVMNAYAGGNRVETAPGWNWRPWLEEVDEPKIAHWAGRYKPWSRPWVIGKTLWEDAEARVRERYRAAGLD